MIFKSIALRDDFAFRLINNQLIKRLKKKYKSQIIVFVNSKQGANNYEELLEKKIINEIIYFDDLDEKISPADHENILNISREVERKINFNLNKLRMMERSFGKEFYMAAPNMPYGPKRKYDYYWILNYYNNVITKIINKLKLHKISFFLNPAPIDEIICKGLKIDCRLLFPSRIENYWFWSSSHIPQPSNIKKEFNNFKNRKKYTQVLMNKSYFHDGEWRKKMKKSPEIRLFKRIIDLFKRQVLYFLKPTINRYYFFSFFKYLLNEYFLYKQLTSKNLLLLKDIKNKFIYFPLSTEPENALHIASTECFDQLNVLATISKELPADVFLVVKETIYSLGTRNKDFYKRIRSFKNVFLLNANEQGLDVIKKSIAVANISGSSGLEAALLGKPVINFGKRNFYDFLPHVINVSTNENFTKKISLISEEKFDLFDSKKNGYFLQESIKKTSFNMDVFTILKRDKFSEKNLKALFTSLEKSIF